MSTDSSAFCPLSDDRLSYWDTVLVLSNPHRTDRGDEGLDTMWCYQRARLTLREAVEEAIERVGKGCYYSVLHLDRMCEEHVTVTFWPNATQCLDDYLGDNIAAVVTATRGKAGADYYDEIPF
jgi:hypothetical protein